MDTDIDDLLGESNDDPFPNFQEEEDVETKDEAEEQESKPEDHTKAELAELKAQLAELKNQRSSPAPAPVNNTPAPAQKSRNDIVKELEANFLNNPGETLYQVLEASQRMAEQNSKNSSLPLAQQTARMMANEFKNSKRSDPFFKAAESEFDDLVKKATPSDVASINPDQFNEAIENLYDLAVGKTLRKKGNGRSNNPPPYGASKGGGSSHSAGTTQRKYSSIEREMIRSARDEYGMDDKQIKAMLEAGDE